MHTNRFGLLNVSTIVFLAALCFAAASPAFGSGAQEHKIGPPAPSLRAIGNSDFTFYQFQDPLLFPDVAVTVNPAMAAALSDHFIDGVLDAPYTRNETTLTRADNSIGQKGGTSDTVVQSLLPTATYLELLPSKMKKLPGVMGFDASANLSYNDTETVKTNYDSTGQSAKTTSLTWPFGATAGALYAKQNPKSTIGLAADLSYAMNRHAFQETQTVVGSNIVTTYSSALNPYDIYTGALDLRGGIKLPLSRSAEFDLAAGVTGGLSDQSTNYTAVDTNGDGFADEILTYHDWYLSTGPGAPTVTAKGYDNLDRTWSVKALLSPELRVALTDDLELFTDGTWNGFDYSDRTTYQHITYSGSSPDQSVANAYLNSSLTTGQVLVGLAVGKSTDSLLKVGVGYQRIDTRYSQTGVDAAGNSVYSNINPNHYPEVSLGTAPAYDTVVQAVTGLGQPPWSDVTNALILEGGWEYRSGPQVRFFANVRVSGSSRAQQYWVFNLDTRTPWNETVTSNALSWGLTGTAGVAIQVSRTMALTIDCVGDALNGNVAQNAETLPFDTVLGKDTTNGSTDQTTTTPVNVTIHAGFSIAY